jgi:FkbM family methyltransferase
LGYYEGWTARVLRDEFKPGDVFVDVGAHIGTHALPAARHLTGLGGHVFAFEPARDSISKLERAAARAGLTNITVVPTALGRSPGSVDLRGNGSATLGEVAMRSVYGSGDVVDEVPITTFDSWADGVTLQQLDIVKIDVEGAEHDVLYGMQGCLRSLRPRVVIIELIDKNLRLAGSSKAELLELMLTAGTVRLTRRSATYHFV